MQPPQVMGWRQLLVTVPHLPLHVVPGGSGVQQVPLAESVQTSPAAQQAPPQAKAPPAVSHAYWQPPATQDATAFAGVLAVQSVHWGPHWLPSSFAAQAPAQAWYPAPHTKPQRPPVQTAIALATPVAQTVPHSPQLLASLPRSTQAPPQRVCPPLQPGLPALPLPLPPLPLPLPPPPPAPPRLLPLLPGLPGLPMPPPPGGWQMPPTQASAPQQGRAAHGCPARAQRAASAAGPGPRAPPSAASPRSTARRETRPLQPLGEIVERGRVHGALLAAAPSPRRSVAPRTARGPRPPPPSVGRGGRGG